MQHVLVIGGGKIGSLIAYLLTQTNDYHVYLGDIETTNHHIDRLGKLPHFDYVQLDATNTDAVSHFVKKNNINAIFSSLPFYCNLPIATLAAQQHIHYFDLTEDVKTTAAVVKLAENCPTALVPQCGLAPGFISIVANRFNDDFPTLDTVKMRVALYPLISVMHCNIH